MMRAVLLLPVILGLSGPFPEAGSEADDPETFVVRMVEKGPTEFVFEPSEVTVRPGDIVRFVQEGVQPHNVEFRETPDGSDVEPDELPGVPYLIRKGQTHELKIDGRFTSGRYEYVCTPHAPLGMRGSITVRAESDNPTDRRLP